MRTARLLTMLLGGAAALVVSALAAVWLLVNPDDFKPRIAAAVKASTGRELMLPGDIKLSVIPWIALQLGPASLGNPPGFKDQPFVSFRHASVRLKLWPLLAKRLEVGAVQIDGLDVALLKNAQGQGNWQGFGKDAAQSGPAEPAAPTGTRPASAGETLKGISGLTVTHARVTYEDLTVENLRFETGAFEDQGVVPVTLSLTAKRASGEAASLDAQLQFSVDSTAERVVLAALDLNGAVTLAGNPRPIRVRLMAPDVDLDLKRQNLAVLKYTLTVAGANLSGGVTGRSIVDDPAFSGSVTLAPLIVREYLPRLGFAVPVTRDPKALTSMSFSGRFEYGANAAQVEDLSATLDDTHLTGQVAVTNLRTRAISFALAVDHIDVDRYLPPAETASKPPPSAPTPSPAPSPGPPLNADGTLTVGSVHVAPLNLSEVRITLAAKDGIMHVQPLTAQVNGGGYSGDITWDTRTTTPVLSLDEHLTGIDVGKLAAAQPQQLRVSGRGNLDLKASGRGAGANEIIKTLNGHFDANIAGGAVEGLDLGYLIGQGEALLKHQDYTAPNTHRTAFNAFKLSADITNGDAATNDLLISSPVIKITGQGHANISTQGLDFALLVDTLKTAGNVPVQIPVKVTGTFADPAVRPDIEALAKGRLKDVIKDKLKGLFGKP